MNFLRRLPPLFYLGLFPVVCLLWLWADSTRQVMGWDRIGHWKSVALESSASALRFQVHAATGVSAEELAEPANRPGNHFYRFSISYHPPSLTTRQPLFPAPWKA